MKRRRIGCTSGARWVAYAALAACWLGLGGCGPGDLDAVQRQRWARAWIGALNSGRWEQVSPLLSSTASIEDPLATGRLDRRAAGFFLNALWTSFPRLHYSILAVSGQGNVIIIEWLARGIRDVPPDGLRGASVLVIESDGIESLRDYFNAAGIFMHPARVQ